MTVHKPLHRLLEGQLESAVHIKVVDVGANPIDGQPPYAPLLAEGQARIVGFEPNAAALAELDRKKGPHETYMPYAVGDGGRHTLRICQAPGMTSLLEPNEDVLRLFHGFSDWGRVMRTEEIDTVRLDDVPETRGVDYLKIDIQGGELMVFKSAPRRLAEALVIHTEVEFLPLYKNQPLFSDVDAYLRSQGFTLHRFEPLVSRAMKPIFVDNNPYSPFKQVIWADAIFVRSFLNLAGLDGEELLKLSTILHDCYQSYDLVHVLLAEHDRRTEGRLAPAYLASVTSRGAG
jgi:FkbM family methyltransferase